MELGRGAAAFAELRAALLNLVEMLARDPDEPRRIVPLPVMGELRVDGAGANGIRSEPTGLADSAVRLARVLVSRQAPAPPGSPGRGGAPRIRPLASSATTNEPSSGSATREPVDSVRAVSVRRRSYRRRQGRGSGRPPHQSLLPSARGVRATKTSISLGAAASEEHVYSPRAPHTSPRFPDPQPAQALASSAIFLHLTPP